MTNSYFDPTTASGQPVGSGLSTPRAWLLRIAALLLFFNILSAPAQQRANVALFADDAPARAAAAGSPLAAALFHSRPLTLDVAALRTALAAAPPEGQAGAAPLVLALPQPDGSNARFAVVEAPIMEPGLAVQFPQIKTYRGVGLDDPRASVRLDLTPLGFHAQIIAPGQSTVYIDPLSRTDTQHYLSFWRRDMNWAAAGARPSCGVVAEPAAPTAQRNTGAGTGSGPAFVTTGSVLRTYRLAVAATGEYTGLFGGTVAGGQAAIVTTMNRVVGVYELELAIRLVLIANNSSIVYTNAATDPYTNGSPGTLLTENQNNLDSVIGSANYDIGHVFTTASGGVAILGAVCNNSRKGQGTTGIANPVGDAFAIDYVAHEMGHQFGANHTFNSSAGACGGGNRSSTHAYEPGSGSTIMAYASICGADDLQQHSDAYFHVDSYESIQAYAGAQGCAVNSNTGNSLPVVAVLPANGKVLPVRTPFKLKARATDGDGDALTYCWEEYDRGPTTTLASLTVAQIANDNVPLFRSFVPSDSARRYFPRLSDLVNNTTAVGEYLPTVSRALNFRVTVRDQHNGTQGVVGGLNSSATVSMTTTSAAGPFLITAPNTAVTWAGNSSQTVTWDVAGTTGNGVNCATVNILLSTDGGLTYPTYVLQNTPNDGSQVVTVPNMATAQARIQVEADDNYFFDISNTNFTITTAAPVCNAPTNLVVSNVTATTASVSFVASGTATNYTVTTTPATTPQTANGSPVSLTGLTANTTYMVSIVSNCAGSPANSSPATANFTTAPAPPANDECAGAVALTSATTCVTTSGTATGATQSLAPTGCSGAAASTTANDVWYSFMANNASHTVTAASAFDGVLEIFGGACGSLTSLGCVDANAANASETLTLTNLTANTQYYVRYYPYTFNATPITGPFTICVTNPVPPCDPPTAVTASALTSTTATVSWTASASATNYTVRYTPSGGTTTTVSPNPTGTSVNLMGLTPNTPYSVSVVSNCAGGATSTAAMGSFMTLAPSCAAPTGLTVSSVTQNSATVSFTASGTATNYTVTTSPATPPQTVNGSTVSLMGLSASTMYTVSIVSNCTGAATATSPAATVTFTTSAAPATCNAPTGLTAGSITATSASVSFLASGTATGYTVTTNPATPVQTVSGSPVNFINLTPNTLYSVSIVSNCTGSTTSAAATISFTTSRANLLVSTPLSSPGGAYNNVTIAGGGSLTLTSPLDVAGTLLVQNNGTLAANCQTVNGAGSFTLAAGGTLRVCSPAGISLSGATGDVQVSGARSYAADASYIYVGTAAQSTGNGLPATVRNLGSENANAVSLSQAVTVRQVLTLNAGNLNLGAFNLTLPSDAGGTGMVVNNGAGRALNTGTGTAIVQRYIQPSVLYTGPGYRHYSSPVGSTTVADLAVAGQFAPYVNNAYNALPTPALPVGQFPNVFDYDQGRLSISNPAFDAGWHSPTTTADPLAVTKGYSVNLAPAAVVDLRGELNSGPYNTGALGYGPTADAGYHLLGNPYPAPLDWGLVTAAPSNIPTGLDEAIYIFEPNSHYGGLYRSFTNGMGTNGFTGVLPAMQGFFIRATAAVPAGFTFRNNFRLITSANPRFYRGTADTRPVLRLTLAAAATPAVADEIVLYLETGASASGPDPHFDAVQLANSGATLSLASLMPGPGNEALVINGLPTIGPADAARLVPLVLHVPASGTYQLTALSLLNFAPGQPVQLLDYATGATIDLNQQTTYGFTVAQAGALAGRFAVLLGRPAGPAATGPAAGLAFSIWPNPAQGHAALHLQLAAPIASATATLRDVLGRPVATQKFSGSTAELPTTGLAAGTYLLTLTVPGQVPATRRVVVE